MNEKRALSPVNAMFGNIAGVYDFLNHFLSLGIDKYWRKKLVDACSTPKNSLVLDLAAGTLDVSIKIAKTFQARVTAIDFCVPMLEKGKKKLNPQLASKIMICAGDALSLPLPAESVDRITIAFGIRNITPRKNAFQEMLRVLKPGGKACILEFGSGKEKIWGGAYNLYLYNLLPLIGLVIGKNRKAYDYLAATIREFPPAEILASEMAGCGFTNVKWQKLTSGIVCLHTGEKTA